MEDLRRDGMRIQNNTIVNIKDEYVDLIREYKNKLFMNIIDIVQENMRGIPEHKIEVWIEDYLLSDLKAYGLREINKVEYYLEDVFKRSINKLQSSNKTNDVFDFYQEQVESIKYELKDFWLDDVVSEFQREFPKKIMHYYDVFYGISDQRFERGLDNIVDEVRRVLNSRFETFIEDYHFIINNGLKSNISSMGNKFGEFEEKNVNKDEQYNNILNLLGLLGFNLYNVNDKYFVRNDRTGEFTPMEFDNDLLKAKDGSRFAFMVSDNQYSYMDEKKDIMLILTDKKIEMTNMMMKDRLSMVEDIDGLKFYSNNVQLDNNDAYNKILLVLKEKVPVYYDNLLTNLEIRELVDGLSKSRVDYMDNLAREALWNLGVDSNDKTNDKMNEIERNTDSMLGVNSIEKSKELENLMKAKEALMLLGVEFSDRDLEENDELINSNNGSRGR